MPKAYITEKQRQAASYTRAIGSLIRRKMAAADIKQYQAAHALGVTPQGMSYILKNGTLTLAQVIQLHKLMNFTTEDFDGLLGGLWPDEAEKKGVL